MRKEFKHAIEDIKKGENLTIYLLLPPIVILTVLDGLKIYEDSYIEHFIIVTLVLLLMKTLGISWNLTYLKDTENKSSIKILTSWPRDVIDLVQEGSNTIVMVQSWFPDSPTLADRISTKAKTLGSSQKLKVKMFLLDPNMVAGALRSAELDGEDLSLFDQNLNCHKRDHKRLFETSVKTFIERTIKTENIEVEIWTYLTMPTLKLYIIDENDYLFCWFGAQERSTVNVALHLEKNNPNCSQGDLATIEKLDNHMKNLKGYSNLFWKTGDDFPPPFSSKEKSGLGRKCNLK